MRRTQQVGAVMIAVLVVSAILAVLLGYATLAINQRLDLAEQSKLKLLEKAEVYGKVSEITYLIATQRITSAGVSRGLNQSRLMRDDSGLWLHPLVGDEIRTDGYIYNSSGIKFSIQNQAGLIPINSANQYWLKRWLSAHKYTPAEQNRLAAVLADYLDGDDRQRPGGHEEPLNSPGNYLAQSCKELRRIDEWKIVLEEYSNFLDVCGLDRNPALNLNSVPKALWQRLWPNSTDQVSAARGRGEWITRDTPASQFEPTMINIREDLQARLGGTAHIVRVWGRYSSMSVRISPLTRAMNSYDSKSQI